jgi:hypothetical protein
MSRAVTITPNAVPATTLVGAVIKKLQGAAGSTAIVVAPAIEASAPSRANMVCTPAVDKLVVKLCVPSSLLVKV